MKKILTISFVLAAGAAMLTGCSSSGAKSEKPVLAVSIDPQKKMLQEIVGDRYDVFAVMPAGANPETYDPPMSARAKAAKAQAYFAVGHLPFEDDAAGQVPMIDTSEGIEPLHGTHGNCGHDHGHEHGDADPHVWTSLRNAKVMAANMLAYLVETDPENAKQYQANFQRLANRLDSLDAVVAERLQAAGAHAFAVWHPSLSYYARDYGLHQISVGQESKEMPIGLLREVIDEARADSVRVFFFQQEYDSRQAGNVNREIGSRLVTINPLAYDWEDQIMLVTDELAK